MKYFYWVIGFLIFYFFLTPAGSYQLGFIIGFREGSVVVQNGKSNFNNGFMAGVDKAWNVYSK